MFDFTPNRSEQLIDRPDYADRLEGRLRESLQGDVQFDHGTRATYSTDGSNYRQIPIGVVFPRDKEDVVRAVAACREFGAPITGRGTGTSLAGQCCNVTVVIDFSRYMGDVIEIDPEARTARVQPGVILDRLREQAVSHGLTFGPDPSTHQYCTMGGMIGNDSCGVRSVMAAHLGRGARTSDNVHQMEVLLYDGTRLTVGPTSEAELQRLSDGEGREGEIYRSLREIREQYQEVIRERFPQIPRRVSGYNLESLLVENECNIAQSLVGSEGTCAIVLEAVVHLVPARLERTLVVLGYESVYEAADHVPQVMQHRPVGLEGVDDQLVEYMRRKSLHPEEVQLLPEGGGWLLVEFGADSKEEADTQAERFADEIKREENPPTTKIYTEPWEIEKLWQVREGGLAATAHVPNMREAYPGWEDAAVAPENLGSYLREFRDLLKEFHYEAALYGHFGQGCVHSRITFDLVTAPGVQKWLRFLDRVSDLVVKHNGSISGEHGDGQARAALLVKMYGEELVEAMRRFKAIWDPQGKMNPGKVTDPFMPDQNLRLGPRGYRPQEETTHFAYPDDHGSFINATTRCVGVGKCRKTESGTMCPSYMVTKEEKHSTRGRSRLLFEMLQGDVLPDRWHSRHVHEALDLCLACKGCKGECPVNVDMATYKAEFLSRYFKRHLRPITAYTLGWIYWWSRIASKMPRVANFFSQTPYLSGLVKRLGGVAPERDMPAFANPTFVAWFRQHRPWHPSLAEGTVAAARRAGEQGTTVAYKDVPRYQSDSFSEQQIARRLNPQASEPPLDSRRVMLFPDTFTNYLMPEAGKAAVEVLESMGYEVIVPDRPLCCGRPLYDFGMLRTAKKLWRQMLVELQPLLKEGVAVVGLEPSCIAAFRDELVNFFPQEPDAQRLSRQAFMLSEFLERQNYMPPTLHRRALVHGHCHHKAIMHMDAEIAVLKKMELDYELLDSGCCGMAGSFGFEKKKYDVSVQVGERSLLPRVRETDEETLIITNGFSCKQQIEQLTGRQSLHLAEVLRMAIQQNAGAARPQPTEADPEYQPSG